MIEINEIFSDSDKRIAVWCENVSDTNELAIACESIITNNVHLISVAPETVQNVWTYLEKSDVEILTRFYFNPISKNIDTDMYNLAENISSVFKRGADGTQIFIKMRDFERFTDMLQIVRDDLFFEKKLCVAMDISDIDVNNLEFIFQKLKALRTDALTLSLNEDTGTKSDFVGRVYAILQNLDFDGDLHFILQNNFERIDQAIRLIESVKPELSERVRFFLEH